MIEDFEKDFMWPNKKRQIYAAVIGENEWNNHLEIDFLKFILTVKIICL